MARLICGLPHSISYNSISFARSAPFLLPFPSRSWSTDPVRRLPPLPPAVSPLLQPRIQPSSAGELLRASFPRFWLIVGTVMPIGPIMRVGSLRASSGPRSRQSVMLAVSGMCIGHYGRLCCSLCRVQSDPAGERKISLYTARLGARDQRLQLLRRRVQPDGGVYVLSVGCPGQVGQ